MRAGWGRVEFTPREAVPLAGYGHLRDRLSTHVRDPLFVRALAFEDGDTRVVLVVYDLLMVVEELHVAVLQRLADTNARVLVHATHTHSAPGGFGRGWLIERVVGRHRPGTIEQLAGAGERAARQALGDLAPAKVGSTVEGLPGLNGNRREPGGPVDEELTVLRVVRSNDEAMLVSYSAHPVIVAERDHFALSADYPGLVVNLLERQVAFAAFVQGALGGVDVFFPREEGVTADDNLRRMAEPLARLALALREGLEPRDAALRFARREWQLPRPDSRPFYDDQRWARRLDAPLRRLLNALFSEAGLASARVQGFAVGDFALVGTPADLGVSIDLAGKRHARSRGLAHPVVASQCDGYLGYLHLAADYQRAPAVTVDAERSKEARSMGVYENGLGIFGRGMGQVVLEQAEGVLGDLALASATPHSG